MVAEWLVYRSGELRVPSSSPARSWLCFCDCQVAKDNPDAAHQHYLWQSVHLETPLEVWVFNHSYHSNCPACTCTTMGWSRPSKDPKKNSQWVHYLRCPQNLLSHLAPSSSLSAFSVVVSHFLHYLPLNLYDVWLHVCCCDNWLWSGTSPEKPLLCSC